MPFNSKISSLFLSISSLISAPEDASSTPTFTPSEKPPIDISKTILGAVISSRGILSEEGNYTIYNPKPPPYQSGPNYGPERMAIIIDSTSHKGSGDHLILMMDRDENGKIAHFDGKILKYQLSDQVAHISAPELKQELIHKIAEQFVEYKVTPNSWGEKYQQLGSLDKLPSYDELLTENAKKILSLPISNIEISNISANYSCMLENDSGELNLYGRNYWLGTSFPSKEHQTTVSGTFNSSTFEGLGERTVLDRRSGLEPWATVVDPESFGQLQKNNCHLGFENSLSIKPSP